MRNQDYTSTSYLIGRLTKEHIGKHKTRLLFAVACMVIAAAATAANAWMMEPVLDQIFLEKNKSMLIMLPLGVLGLAIIKAAASYGQTLYMKYIGQRIITDMQVKLYEHLLSCDIAYFQENSTGKLLSRFSNDIAVIRKSISTILTNVIKETFTLVFLVGLMFYNSVTLALVSFAVFPLAVYPMVKLGKKMRRVTDKTQEQLAEFIATLDDSFQGIRVVKAYGREKYEVARASGFIENVFRLYIKAARIESFSSPTMEMLAGCAVAAVIWYGGFQVINGVTTPGSFFSFITALIMAYKPMKSLSGTNTSIQEGLASVRRFFAAMDIVPTIADKPGAKELKMKTSDIEFEKVTFHYAPEKTTLHDISIVAPAGKRVALVGESGSGKTTIMNLILRFYDPISGHISISGTDIKNVTLSSLRQHISLVSQDTFLFDDSVRANVSYGKPDATEDEIINACIAAAAHDFIVELPQGYDTLIGQQGLRLSGGQRQRLTIARAMLKNAPILLLDEATSSLDPVSEHQVQMALDRLMKGRTTVVIAHRLSTIVNADIIYVLSHGRIAEAGSHRDLLAKGGEYKKLYDKQFGTIQAVS